MSRAVVVNLRVLRYALWTALADLRAVYTWRTWAFGWLSRMLCQVAFFALLGRLVGSHRLVVYLVVGNAVYVVAHVVFLTVSSTAWERFTGTLPLLVASPSPMFVVFAGRSAQWLVDGLACGAVSLFVVGPLFGVPVPMPAALWAVPLMALVALSVYAFALLLGGLTLMAMEMRSVVANLGGFLLMLFTGVQVPVSFWPAPVETAASVLPLRHGLRAIRELLDGAPAGHIAAQAGLESLVGLAWLLIAASIFHRLAEGGRKNGSIEFGG